MNPHCLLIKSSAVCGCPAMKCPSSSKDPMNGEIVSGVPASGAGAPYVPHRALSADEIAADWEDVSVRFALSAQALPSWGLSVVVSLSVNRPVDGDQRRALAAVLMVEAMGVQCAMEAVSLRIPARPMPSVSV